MANERKDMKYLMKYASNNEKVENIMRNVNKETLRLQHERQQEGKAKRIDGIGKEVYSVNLEERLEDLIDRMKTFSYRPKPVKRVYIPKGNGKLRPLVPSYEDRLVQGVMAEILNAIYEPKFLDISYGFRPNRSCHQAIKEINDCIMFKKVNYIIEADIKGFFDNVNHNILMKFLEHDINDKTFFKIC